ncbi:MAG: hypothetical protein SFX73_18350 [Kofleriaceae bacterium]|nr:hypothetical protein [Kofleriaceae bacterium]
MRRILTVVVIGLVLYLGWALWDYQALLAWLERARPLPFFAAIALLPALAFPMTPLFLLAGATFGVKLALIGTLAALAVNLTLCYVLARGKLRKQLVRALRRFNYDLPDFGAPDRNALRFSVMTKLAPGIPGFVKNYGLAAAGVPFGIYLGVSMAITGAYAAALILLGESLLTHELRPGVIAIIVVAVLAFALSKVLKRRRRPTAHAV